MIARLNTIKVLKGSLEAGKSNRVRNTLMITQFVISSLLICCTVIAWQQLDYLRRQPLGYNKEEVISIPVPDNVNAAKALQHMRTIAFRPNRGIKYNGARILIWAGAEMVHQLTSVVSFDYKGHTT